MSTAPLGEAMTAMKHGYHRLVIPTREQIANRENLITEWGSPDEVNPDYPPPFRTRMAFGDCTEITLMVTRPLRLLSIMLEHPRARLLMLCLGTDMVSWDRGWASSHVVETGVYIAMRIAHPEGENVSITVNYETLG